MRDEGAESERMSSRVRDEDVESKSRFEAEIEF